MTYAQAVASLTMVVLIAGIILPFALLVWTSPMVFVWIVTFIVAFFILAKLLQLVANMIEHK